MHNKNINKVRIYLNLRLECKNAVGIGCLLRCSGIKDNQECDPTDGREICSILQGDRDCSKSNQFINSAFKASLTYDSRSLVIISMGIAVGVNIIVIGAFLLIRKFAKFKGFVNLNQILNN